MQTRFVAPVGRVVLGGFLCLAQLACGNGPATEHSTTISDGNGTTTVVTNGNSSLSNAVINKDASSSKMVKQASGSADDSADFSEILTTGQDDGGGTQAAPVPPSASFSFNLDAGVNLASVGSDFNASAHFNGHNMGGGAWDGNASVHVVPQMQPAPGMGDDGNLTLVITYDTNVKLANGDVLVLATEPNLTVQKSGRRGQDAVTRVLNGKVHRALTAAADANADFDLLIDHNNTRVADVYAAGRLKSRTVSGSTTVTNNLTQEVATITFNDMVRSAPQTCLCPTGGSVNMSVVASDGSVTQHTYTFSSTCGTSSVEVSGSTTASVSRANMTGETMGSTTAGSAGDGNAQITSTTTLRGQLSWQDCVAASSN